MLNMLFSVQEIFYVMSQLFRIEKLCLYIPWNNNILNMFTLFQAKPLVLLVDLWIGLQFSGSKYNCYSCVLLTATVMYSCPSMKILTFSDIASSRSRSVFLRVPQYRLVTVTFG